MANPFLTNYLSGLFSGGDTYSQKPAGQFNFLRRNPVETLGLAASLVAAGQRPPTEAFNVAAQGLGTFAGQRRALDAQKKQDALFEMQMQRAKAAQKTAALQAQFPQALREARTGTQPGQIEGPQTTSRGLFAPGSPEAAAADKRLFMETASQYGYAPEVVKAQLTQYTQEPPTGTSSVRNYQTYVSQTPSGMKPRNFIGYQKLLKAAEQGVILSSYLPADGDQVPADGDQVPQAIGDDPQLLPGTPAYFQQKQLELETQEREEKARIEKQARTKQRTADARKIKAKMDMRPLIVGTMSKAQDLADLPTTSGTANAAKGLIKESDQAQLNRLVDTLQAQVGLSQLITIKEEGGTFGALQEKELDMLVNRLSTLDPLASPAELKRSFAEIKRLYDLAITGMKEDFVLNYSDWLRENEVPWPATGTGSGVPHPGSGYFIVGG